MTMRALPLALLAPLAVLVGCGERTSAASDPSPSPEGPPVLKVDGEVQIGCGGESGWPASVMADGLQGVLTDAEVVAAFRSFLADPQVGTELEVNLLAAGAEDTEWRVLAADGDEVALGLGRWTDEGPARDAYVFGMERKEEGWRWTGGGNCSQLGPVVEEGLTWVEVSSPPGGVVRDTTTVDVGVTEGTCTGGRDPLPHLREPYVEETAQSVTIYWTSDPPGGVSSCIGPPPTPTTLTLSEPLGDRALLDGSRFPPAPVGPSDFGWGG